MINEFTESKALMEELLSIYPMTFGFDQVKD
jgi:hypothetical protein